MRGKITECWLAEKEGIFFLITRALLLIKRAWLLDADWLSTHALSWFHASNGFWKGIQKRIPSEFDLNMLFQLDMKENRHATKRSLLVEKQKDFSDQKCIDSQPEKSLSGDSWCRTKHRVHGCQISNLFSITIFISINHTKDKQKIMQYTRNLW